MTGRQYYLTTIGAWRRHAGRCAETHFVTVRGPEGPQSEEATDHRNGVPAEQKQAKALPTDGERTHDEAHLGEQACSADDATQILALVDADEGAHLAMENDAEFEALPHPLARAAVSQRVSTALAQFGVGRGDDTFTVADKLAGVTPLLRHRVF